MVIHMDDADTCCPAFRPSPSLPASLPVHLKVCVIHALHILHTGPLQLRGPSLSSHGSWHTQYPAPEGRLPMPYSLFLSKGSSRGPWPALLFAIAVLVKCTLPAHSSSGSSLMNFSLTGLLFPSTPCPSAAHSWPCSVSPEAPGRRICRKKFLLSFLLPHRSHCTDC